MPNVYHGSQHKFDIARPSFTRRGKMINGEFKLAYEGISLHATPYKWIALAYTGKIVDFKHKKDILSIVWGVPVKNKDDEFKQKIVGIYGKRSLKYSLDKLYGNGGYLYTFNAKNFKWVKGLGKNEVISYKEEIPDKIEFIKNPVKKMKKLGVKFVFINIIKQVKS